MSELPDSKDVVITGLTIRGYQEMLNNWAEANGFVWSKDEVDDMLLRLHSEISEACEAIRDENWEQFASEMADIFIRLVNCCQVMGIDLQNEVHKKHQKNLTRKFLHGRKRK